MTDLPAMQLQSSADHLYIELALKSQWEPFQELKAEMDAFTPRPISDYQEVQKAEIQRLTRLNPQSSRESIAQLVAGQFELAASARVQFSDMFSKRFMSIYVTIVLLATALCEAAINSVLALGLSENKTPELFALLERSELREKWRSGPKTFLPAYHLHPGDALSHSLNELVKRRNSLVHYKPHIQLDGETSIRGSKFERISFQDGTEWIERFFSLPYDLTDHFRGQAGPAKSFHMMMLYESAPIVRATAHKSPNMSLQRPAFGGP